MNNTRATDALLVQGRWTSAQALVVSVAALQAAMPGCHAQAVWNQNSGETYVYLAPAARLMLGEAELRQHTSLCTQLFTGLADVRVSRLEKAFDVQGAAAGQSAPAHYVVEMDPETGWEAELFDWYNTEHMPMLSQVPGTVRARRYLNHDHGPRSLACYDLVAPTVLNSPPWLLVRATPWSDRMRPHFTNTKRTMFDCTS
jgi:hypothetical protein